MTRKDYQKIARILQEERAPETMVRAFAQMLQADNYRFSSDRFEQACKGLTAKLSTASRIEALPDAITIIWPTSRTEAPHRDR